MPAAVNWFSAASATHARVLLGERMVAARRRGQICGGVRGPSRGHGSWALVAAALAGAASQDCSACNNIDCGDNVVVAFSHALPGPATYELRVVADGTCMETTLGAPPPLDAGARDGAGESGVASSAGAGGAESSSDASPGGGPGPTHGSSCPAAGYRISGDYDSFVLQSRAGHLEVTISRDGVVLASGSDRKSVV